RAAAWCRPRRHGCRAAAPAAAAPASARGPEPPKTWQKPRRSATNAPDWLPYSVEMLEIRPDALANYPDVLTSEVVTALRELAPLDDDRHAVMAARLERREQRAKNGERIAFLDPASIIARTKIP